MNNAKYSLVLGGCVTALVMLDCSASQSPAPQAVSKAVMLAIDDYCDRRPPFEFEPLPDAGADSGSPHNVQP